MAPGIAGGPGYGGGPSGAAAQTKPDPNDYAGLSEWSFQNGKTKDGLSYYYAHLLSDDQAAEESLQHMKWVPALKHPALAIHFAIGVDSTFEEDPRPIGTTQNLSTGNQRNPGGPAPGPYGGGAGGGAAQLPNPGFAGGPRPGAGMGPGGAAGGAQDATLQRYGGELATLLIEGMSDRFQRGEFGQVLLNAPSGGPAGGGPAGGAPAMVGGIGPAFSLGPGGGAPMLAGGPSNPQPAGGGRGDGASQVVPGLTMLGRSNKRELMSKAKAQNADVLIVLSVTAKSARGNTVDSDTMVEMFDVVSGEPIKGARTRRLNNVKVQKDREKNSGDATVASTFERFFEAVDEQLVMQSLPPGIQPEHVSGRAKALAEQPPLDLLAAVTELQFFRKKELINDEQVRWCYVKLLGDSHGESLLQGDEAKRKEILASLFPKE